ncbi:MAG: hypothetical protein HY287_14475 [Planctomycetes bacterium]|nr:hypothetical protein [Planctomycetota bacterium]MBI3835528.1 hypothetical protein [Planctomycetota bacterium]
MKTTQCRSLATIGIGLLLLLGATGCIVTGKDFRTVATPEFQTGVKSLLNGFVDGLFAAMAVDSSSSTSGSTTSGH